MVFIDCSKPDSHTTPITNPTVTATDDVTASQDEGNADKSKDGLWSLRWCHFNGPTLPLIYQKLLFVPMGYLLLLWFHRLRKNPWLAVGICAVVSVGIELLQELTGLGMADWKDVLSDALGGAVGVLIAKAFAVRSSSSDY